MERLEAFLRVELTSPALKDWNYPRLMAGLNADPALVGECVDARLLPDRCRNQEISEWDAWILSRRLWKRIHQLLDGAQSKHINIFSELILGDGGVLRTAPGRPLLKPELAAAYIMRCKDLLGESVQAGMLPERCLTGRIDVNDVRRFRREFGMRIGVSQGAPYAN